MPVPATEGLYRFPGLPRRGSNVRWQTVGGQGRGSLGKTKDVAGVMREAALDRAGAASYGPARQGTGPSCRRSHLTPKNGDGPFEQDHNAKR